MPQTETAHKVSSENIPTQPRAYLRRYYIMTLFCFEVVLVLTAFNSISPIAESLRVAHGLRTQDLAVLTMINYAVFILFLPAVSWFIHRYNMRRYVVIMSSVVALSLALRCIPVNGRPFVILIMVQNTIASFISVGVMIAPPLITVTWFPKNEWRVATNVGIFLPAFGSSFSFLIGPALVPTPSDNPTPEEIETIIHRVRYYFYGLFVLTTLTAILIIAYFPAEPPSPPTNVAEYEHEHSSMGIIDSLKTIATSVRFWICTSRTFFIGAPTAVMFSLLLPYLEPKGVSQNYAGIIGFVNSLVGVPVAVILGKLADATGKELKALIVAPTFIALIGAVWLFLIGHNFIPYTDRSIFLATFLYLPFGGSTLGLIMELTIENLYPVPEPFVATGLITMASLTTLIISGVFLSPKVDVGIVDYIVLLCTICGTVAACLLPTVYNRLDAEENTSGAPTHEEDGIFVTEKF